MSQRGTPKSATASNTNLDDWDTDPDYVRNMDEIDQRWGGNKRTVGSIDMNKLIDEVRRDHKSMRERFNHPSQRDYSDGFGGKFGVQHDRRDKSALDYDHHEKLSKHTSQEISHKVVTSSQSSIIKSGHISDTKKSLLEKSDTENKSVRRSPPPINRLKTSGNFKVSPEFEKVSSQINREEKSSTVSGSNDPSLTSLKSIQDKIDAFKKQFEDMKSEVSTKSETVKVYKKSSTLDKDGESFFGSSKLGGARPTSPGDVNSSTNRARPEIPKTSIKSLSEKFEKMRHEESEDFRKKTEAKRREFFDEVKSQMRDTRKDYDRFDSINLDKDPTEDLEKRMREKLEGLTSSMSSSKSRFTPSNSSSRASPQSPTADYNLGTKRRDGSESNLSSSSMSRPKVYTHRETKEERIVSKIVKENDRIVENETKRSVEHSSSRHGSSDEEDVTKSIRVLQDDDISPSQRQIYQHKESTSSPTGNGNPRRTPTGAELSLSGLMARTLYDYQAVDDDELSFDVDDLITNIEKIDPGWYKGTITRGSKRQVGLFPANYVRLLNDHNDH